MKLSLTFLLLALLLSPVGCKSPEQAAYVTSDSVAATANAAIGAYDTYTLAHPPTVAELAKARAVIQTYRNAVETARVATISFKQGALSQPAYQAAIDALSAASANLLATINPLLPPAQRTK